MEIAVELPEWAEPVARRFHEAYERLAPDFNYQTRPSSAVPWEDVPEDNRRLMIATVAEAMGCPDVLEGPNLRCQRLGPDGHAGVHEVIAGGVRMAWHHVDERPGTIKELDDLVPFGRAEVDESGEVLIHTRMRIDVGDAEMQRLTPMT